MRERKSVAVDIVIGLSDLRARDMMLDTASVFDAISSGLTLVDMRDSTNATCELESSTRVWDVRALTAASNAPSNFATEDDASEVSTARVADVSLERWNWFARCSQTCSS